MTKEEMYVERGIKRSYAAYSKKFKEAKADKVLRQGTRKYSYSRYKDIYKTLASQKRIQEEVLSEGPAQVGPLGQREVKFKSISDILVSDHMTMSYEEAIQYTKGFREQKLKMGKVTFEYGTEWEHKKRPQAIKTKKMTIDFTETVTIKGKKVTKLKSIKERRKMIQRLPSSAVIPMLIAIGYSREEALEYIGY